MADFQEVGRQWARMCKAFRSLPNGCSGCPLVDKHCYHESPFIFDFDRIEYAVMQWAEENPEPVYPTWWKYMCMIGVIPDEIGDKTLGEMTVYSLMNTHIQSDIAQKLGIEPKEVEFNNENK